MKFFGPVNSQLDNLKVSRFMIISSEENFSIHLLTGISCTCCTCCNDVIIFLLFFGATIGTWVGILLGYSSKYGLNQVSLWWIISGSSLCELRCTCFVQFGDIVPSLMNGTVENSSSNTTWNWSDTWPVAGFRTRATDPAWNGECPIYIPACEWGYHLGSPAILPCYLTSNT